jgi:tyrosine-protein kinase Etk/Wzc
MDNVYTATARILPPQQSSSSTLAMLAQLGGPAALLGGAATARNTDLYAGMLKGHTIADRLIERFRLQNRYSKKTVLDTRTQLAAQTTIAAGRDGIISISFDDKDPKFAAQVANSYVEELQALVHNLAISEAAQRRLFFEQQLASARKQLAEAEIALKKTQEDTGLIRLDEQGRALIEAIARLRGEIAAREVELVAARTYATESNPQLQVIRQQIAGLRSELAKLERSGGTGSGDVILPTGRVPEAGLEYLRKYRDLKYNETIYEVLAKQYEVARLDEAKEAAIVQFVDKAVPPDRKSKPYRSLIVLAMTFIAGVLTLLWVLVREVATRARRDPETDQKLRTLRGLVTRL